MDFEKMARGACLPWNSIDAVAEEWERMGFPAVTSKDLAKCMNCPYPECHDCLGGGTGRPVGRPRKEHTEVVGQVSLEIA